MPDQPPPRSSDAPDPEGSATAAGTSRRDWWFFSLVLLPLLASVVTLGWLLITLIGIDPGAAAISGLIPCLVAAWQLRPGAPSDAGPGSSSRSALLYAAALVVLDTLALVVGALTGRLPSWGPGLAVVLLVVHLGFVGLLVLRRDRSRPDPAAHPRDPAPDLHWRHLPEPLRTTTGLVTLTTFTALGLFVLTKLTDGSTESAEVLGAGFAWGSSLVLVGLCVALDMRGSARFAAHRSQLTRGHRGFLAAPGRLSQLRWWMRGAGVVTTAAGVVIAGLFWPWQ